MSHDWKPGDVAALTIGEEVGRGVVGHDQCWLIFGHSYFTGIRVGNDALIQDARPLVVIDPEDREQAIRLTELWYQNDTEGGDPHRYGQMQAALREFADPKPPKPDEPLGLGAVVEDADGNRFIRYGASLAPWIGHAENAGLDPDRPYRYWSGINAVRVLSDGVQW